ncbi:MAG: DUF3558 domain-containing protein [Pseudonocardiaceae bacterium]
MSGETTPHGPGRMNGRVVLGAVMVGLLIASAGCIDEMRAQGAHNPIPRVENPRKIDAIADRPCELLKPKQAAEFGLDLPPRQLAGRLGNVECEWRSSGLDVWVYISPFTDKLTLEEVYDRREVLLYFEVTEIGGYPAIVSRPEATLPVCDIDIKPAERQSVTVTYDSTALHKTPQQACVVGKQVAEAVLKNLPPPS